MGHRLYQFFQVVLYNPISFLIVVPCTTRAIEVVNVFRKDEKKNSDCNEELLELGPSREDKYFKVPKIINE